jgi:hypothetical protein
MTDTNFRGPVANMGAMEDSPSNVQPTDGPSYSYQGQALSDIRKAPFDKDGIGPGRVAALLDNARIVTIATIPAALSTVGIAAAAAVDTSVAMTLVTVTPAGSAGVQGVATGVPIVPFGTTAAVTAALAIGFGFATGTTSAGSSSVAVDELSKFAPGQSIVIGGVGNAGKTSSFLTKVVTVAAGVGAGAITVSPAPVSAINNAPIGGANLFNPFTPPGTQFGPSAAAPTAWSPHLAGGLLRLQNPAEMLSRCISITGVATTAVGGTFTVAGWDIYGQAMTETITKAAGTTTAYGLKAFKFIGSVTPNFADAITYSVGYGDTIGLPLRQDLWEYLEVRYNGTLVITNVGTVAPDLTSPATAVTGDVRGTVQLSTAGAATAVASPVATATNGVVKLVIVQTVPLLNAIKGTPLNTVPLYGQTQV